MIRIKTFGLFLLICLISSQSLLADTIPDSSITTYLNMDMEELLNIKVLVPAAITHLSKIETPAAITVIDSTDIINTPARNIYDLMEIYVPGAFWMNHEEGPHMGFRGIIVSRNIKYLLLVNGRNMNNKARFGAKSELEAWDLMDIKKIEIIRGPGSVTYGPGAVGGVINIITKDASGNEGVKVAASYLTKYNSKAATLSYGFKKNKFSLYSYGNITCSEGYNADHYLVSNNNELGIVGQGIYADEKPLEFYMDYRDVPQAKAHIDIKYGKNWSFWSRYTQQGSTWKGNEIKTEYNGAFVAQQGTQDKQFTSALQYENKFGDNLNIQCLLSFDSYDTERTGSKARDTLTAFHPLNKKADFAETEIFARGIVLWKINKITELAIGMEYSWDRFGVGWGDDVKEMRLGDEANIVNGPDSYAIREGNKGSADRNGNEIFAGSGWSTNTYSVFTEFNIEATSYLKFLVSARADKNTYSDYLFSPRIATISKLSNTQYVKLITQRSLRMNTASQNYIENHYNIEPSFESLTGIEIIYNSQVTKNLAFQFSAYKNNVEVLDFDGVKNASIPIGDLNLFGFEAEGKYRSEKIDVGVNYSYIKQIDWNMNDSLTNNGISYADYNQVIGDDDVGYYTIYSYGNDLNHCPNQSIKAYTNIRPVKWFSIHANFRFMFDFQGSKDGLSALENAVLGSPLETEINSVIDELYDENVYGLDFRANISTTFHITNNLNLQLYMLNLFNLTGNIRYAYSSGIDEPSPHQTRYVEEPVAFGVKAFYRFK